MCCSLVDFVLNLPKPIPGQPRVRSYRRSWHSLASLLCLLVVITLLQSLVSIVGFVYCNQQLSGCEPFLPRDPCLKTIVPFFIIGLVWISIFCSCCCQSPKALSVFLFVGLCGESILGSYMVMFDKSTNVDDHLKSHLERSLRGYCAGQIYSFDSQDMRCYLPFQRYIPSCIKLDAQLEKACNGSRARLGLYHLRTRRHSMKLKTTLDFYIENCVSDLEIEIGVKKNSYQIITYVCLFICASFHFFIALFLCLYDVRRKKFEKLLLREPVSLNGQFGHMRNEILVNTDVAHEEPSYHTAHSNQLPLFTTIVPRSSSKVTFELDKEM